MKKMNRMSERMPKKMSIEYFDYLINKRIFLISHILINSTMKFQKIYRVWIFLRQRKNIRQLFLRNYVKISSPAYFQPRASYFYGRPKNEKSVLLFDMNFIFKKNYIFIIVIKFPKYISNQKFEILKKNYVKIDPYNILILFLRYKQFVLEYVKKTFYPQWYLFLRKFFFTFLVKFIHIYSCQKQNYNFYNHKQNYYH